MIVGIPDGLDSRAQGCDQELCCAVQPISKEHCEAKKCNRQSLYLQASSRLLVPWNILWLKAWTRAGESEWRREC